MVDYYWEITLLFLGGVAVILFIDRSPLAGINYVREDLQRAWGEWFNAAVELSGDVIVVFLHDRFPFNLERFRLRLALCWSVRPKTLREDFVFSSIS